MGLFCQQSNARCPARRPIARIGIARLVLSFTGWPKKYRVKYGSHIPNVEECPACYDARRTDFIDNGKMYRGWNFWESVNETLIWTRCFLARLNKLQGMQYNEARNKQDISQLQTEQEQEKAFTKAARTGAFEPL